MIRSLYLSHHFGLTCLDVLVLPLADKDCPKFTCYFRSYRAAWPRRRNFRRARICTCPASFPSLSVSIWFQFKWGDRKNFHSDICLSISFRLTMDIWNSLAAFKVSPAINICSVSSSTHHELRGWFCHSAWVILVARICKSTTTRRGFIGCNCGSPAKVPILRIHEINHDQHPGQLQCGLSTMWPGPILLCSWVNLVCFSFWISHLIRTHTALSVTLSVGFPLVSMSQKHPIPDLIIWRVRIHIYVRILFWFSLGIL